MSRIVVKKTVLLAHLCSSNDNITFHMVLPQTVFTYTYAKLQIILNYDLVSD